MNDKRIVWIDMARCYGIFLMVWGHSTCPKFAYIWLYSFHMPLFFFLAGATLNLKKYDTVGEFLFAKIKSVLIPYFILCLINICWKFLEILMRDRNYVVIVKYFISIFWQNRAAEYTVGLWFLPCLFITQVLMYLIIGKKECISIRKNVIFILSLLLVGFAYYAFGGAILPWGVDAVPISLAFMFIGYQFRKKEYKLYLSNKIGIGAIVCNMIAMLLNYRVSGYNVDMWGAKYGNPIAFFVAAISGIVAICWVSKSYCNKYLESVGKNSMLIYGLHQIVLALLGRIFNRLFTVNNVLTGYIVSVIEVNIAIIFICCISPIYNKFMNQLWRKNKII